MRRNRGPWRFIAAFGCLLGAPALAGDDHGPNFDIRRDHDHLHEALRRGSAELAPMNSGYKVDRQDLFGTPSFVRARGGLLTGPAPAGFDAHEIAISFVASKPGLFSIEADALRAARVSRDGLTTRSGMRTIWRQQQIDGIDVVGCELRANVTSLGELVSIGSTMLREPAGGFDVKPLRLSRTDAIVIAAEHEGVRLADAPAPKVAAPDALSIQRYERAGALMGDVFTKRVYFPLSHTEMRPAYEIVLYDASGDMWQLTIDAFAGSLLRRISGTFHGGTESASYRVFTSDSPAPYSPGPATPDGSQGTPVSRSLETIVSLDATASPEGWIPDGGNTTVGNNVEAHTDADGDNNPDLPRPIGSPARVFDFPVDFSMAPSVSAEAAVTNAFYQTNWFHDRLYALGWTEDFGNYQLDNFGRGGVGGDPVIADIQDGISVENARFLTTGIDGSDGRMEMFLWPDAPPSGRDGGFDQEIVFHELTHGLSIRLHGSLSEPQSAGLGEGWSDFYPISLLAQPTDDLVNYLYSIGGYSTYFGEPGFDTNYYFGIRRYPYVDDPMRSPVTFEDIDPVQYAVDESIPVNTTFASTVPNSVHNVGEVWCNMLLACRAELAISHGFAANEMMLVLATDGMKISPADPNFIQARDAILLADQVNYGGQNQCALWRGFARRGLGFSAIAPQSPTVSNVIEAFDVPERPEFEYPDGVPTRSVLPVAAPTMTVFLRDTCGDPISPGSALLQFNLNGGGFVPIPLTEVMPTQYEATLPPMECGDTATYYVEVMAGSTTYTDPPTAPIRTYGLAASTANEVRFSDNAETDLGWTFSGDATDGFWERVAPQKGGDRGDPVSDADGSGAAFLTDAVDDLFVPNSDVDGGSVFLTSPLFDCTGAEEAFLTFFTWHSNNFGANPYEDGMVMQISDDDGFSWTPIDSVVANTNHWEFNLVRVGQFVNLTDQVRIRFISSDLGVGGSVVESGVDAIELLAVVCNAPNPADLDGDGTVGSSDLALLIGSWGPCPMAPAACVADLDGDGSVGSADLALLIGNWGG